MTHSIGYPQAVIPPYMTSKLYEYYIGKELTEEEHRKLLEEEATVRPEESEPSAVRKKTAIVAASSQPLSEAPRQVWDATVKNKPRLLLSSDNTSLSTDDTDALSCDLHMQITDLFFRSAFQKYPISDENYLMRCYVHDTEAYNNAFWSPRDETMHFGEVDPRFFNPLVENLGILAHEATHAYTQYSSDLEYSRQSGALNESMSDVYAIMTKHFRASIGRSQPVDASSKDTDWLIGEDTVVNKPENGTALRSMKAPGTAYKHAVLGTDRQPADMDGYVELPSNRANDWGGVHLYSGIPNRAFYQAASTIGGPSWEKPGKIWDAALFASSSTEDFASFAQKTIKAVKTLKYNEGVANIVGQAWERVKVLPSSSTTTTAPSTTTSSKPRRCCFIQ